MSGAEKAQGIVDYDSKDLGERAERDLKKKELKPISQEQEDADAVRRLMEENEGMTKEEAEAELATKKAQEAGQAGVRYDRKPTALPGIPVNQRRFVEGAVETTPEGRANLRELLTAENQAEVDADVRAERIRIFLDKYSRRRELHLAVLDAKLPEDIRDRAMAGLEAILKGRDRKGLKEVSYELHQIAEKGGESKYAKQTRQWIAEYDIQKPAANETGFMPVNDTRDEEILGILNAEMAKDTKGREKADAELARMAKAREEYADSLGQPMTGQTDAELLAVVEGGGDDALMAQRVLDDRAAAKEAAAVRSGKKPEAPTMVAEAPLDKSEDTVGDEKTEVAAVDSKKGNIKIEKTDDPLKGALPEDQEPTVVAAKPEKPAAKPTVVAARSPEFAGQTSPELRAQMRGLERGSDEERAIRRELVAREQARQARMAARNEGGSGETIDEPVTVAAAEAPELAEAGAPASMNEAQSSRLAQVADYAAEGAKVVAKGMGIDTDALSREAAGIRKVAEGVGAKIAEAARNMPTQSQPEAPTPTVEAASTEAPAEVAAAEVSTPETQPSLRETIGDLADLYTAMNEGNYTRVLTDHADLIPEIYKNKIGTPSFRVNMIEYLNNQLYRNEEVADPSDPALKALREIAKAEGARENEKRSASVYVDNYDRTLAQQVGAGRVVAGNDVEGAKLDKAA